MKARIYCVVFLGAIILGVCNAAPLNSNEEEARKFAKDASDKMFTIYDKLVDSLMQLEGKELGDLISALATFVEKSEKMVEIIQSAKQFDHKQFKDEELRNIFEKIRTSADELILGGDRILAILLAVGNLEDLASDKDIENYKNNTTMMAYFPDVQNVFATSNDTEELKYYWSAWRKKNANFAMANFLILVNGLKDAAELTEISANDFWMEEYNMSEMEKVMIQIEPFYRQLHAFLRNQLNKKYGDSVIEKDGLIPEHLFQQILAQVWTNGSLLDENFPHKDLPPYDAILEKNNFDTMKLFKTADKFYESMGFEPVPDSYWGTRLKMNSDEDDGDCRATVLAGSKNVFMVYCQKMDFRKFLQAHGYMAEIHYGLEKSHLPAYYFDSYNLEYAVGEAMILSASSPKHLNNVGIVNDFEFTEEVFMNRLMRLSIHTMLNIPVYYVHTKVMADLLAGKVEMTELNKYYWELMDKYVGVGPPNDRVSNTLDFPFKFYLDLDQNDQARRFNSEVLSYQLYMKLCSITGQYPKGHLQNCDLYGHKEAGDALKKMMKLGSSKSFHEVLAEVLPEDPKLNAISLLEYYFPAFSWLTVSNQQNNVQTGWKHSDKKIDSVKMPGEDDD